jgi:hypothetical protein
VPSGRQHRQPGICALVEAADLGIKASRRKIRITLAPYGCVADYVPFYFAPRSPMLFKLARGYVSTYTDGRDPLIYLVSTVEVVVQAGLRYLFSDGNCAAAVTQISGDLALLDTMVDWDVMRSQMWNPTAEDPDRMRRRMAEFLVRGPSVERSNVTWSDIVPGRKRVTHRDRHVQPGLLRLSEYPSSRL